MSTGGSAAAPSSSGDLPTAKEAGEGFIHSRAFELLARAGFVSRGLVWGIVGFLALKLALGIGGKVTNQQGAFHTIAQQRLGTILLTLVAIGLGGYSLWRLARAAIGHGPEGSDTAFERIAGAASGIAYAILCVLAVKILLGANASSTGDAKQETSGVLGWPAGPWIVGLAGAVMIGVALYQGYRGISQKFLEDSKVEQMGPFLEAWFGRIGTVGHLARMVVFGLIGIFLIKAAVDFNAREAVGLDGALAKLVNREYGPYILGVVAAGLIAFAVYSLSDARYRRI
jgi:hypothetical protein